MKTTIAGPQGVCIAGNIFECDAKLVKLIIDGGFGELVEEPKAEEKKKSKAAAIETAEQKPAPENVKVK